MLDGVLHISWYDHEGIITTNGFRLSEYLRYYLALLYIFQRFDRSAWGRCGDENLRSDIPTGGFKETTVTIDGKEFTFDPTEKDNVLRKPFAIGGRATTVYTCQGTGEQEPGHVIKFTWKEESRLPEWEILDEIKKKVEKEEVTGKGSRLTKAIKKRYQHVLDEKDSLLSYLPTVVASVETDISTKTIRKFLDLESRPRQLVAIVFVKLDGVISRLKGEEYWQVFWDCFRCKSAALCFLSSRLIYVDTRS